MPKNNKGKLICEVCLQNEAIGVASVPGIPYSAAYCTECLKANAHPWRILVAEVSCLGGLEYATEWFKLMVEGTCKRLGKTIEEFTRDVEEANRLFDQYMEQHPESKR